jgi:hypothetical protein
MERKRTTGLGEKFFVSVAILHIGGMGHDPDDQIERVDHDVPPATSDLFERIATLPVDRYLPSWRTRPSPPLYSGGNRRAWTDEFSGST